MNREMDQSYFSHKKDHIKVTGILVRSQKGHRNIGQVMERSQEYQIGHGKVTGMWVLHKKVTGIQVGHGKVTGILCRSWEGPRNIVQVMRRAQEYWVGHENVTRIWVGHGQITGMWVGHGKVTGILCRSWEGHRNIEQVMKMSLEYGQVMKKVTEIWIGHGKVTGIWIDH